MKIESDIKDINRKRREAMQKLSEAMEIFKRTECSLGAQLVFDCILELIEAGANEY